MQTTYAPHPRALDGLLWLPVRLRYRQNRLQVFVRVAYWIPPSTVLISTPPPPSGGHYLFLRSKNRCRRPMDRAQTEPKRKELLITLHFIHYPPLERRSRSPFRGCRRYCCFGLGQRVASWIQGSPGFWRAPLHNDNPCLQHQVGLLRPYILDPWIRATGPQHCVHTSLYASNWPITELQGITLQHKFCHKADCREGVVCPFGVSFLGLYTSSRVLRGRALAVYPTVDAPAVNSWKMKAFSDILSHLSGLQSDGYGMCTEPGCVR